jgi:hypothetical protein
VAMRWILVACLFFAQPAWTAEGDTLTESQIRTRSLALYGTAALALGVYGYTNWWGDNWSGRFRTVDEGWFGRDTPEGGADKLGHAMSNYVGTRLLTRAFEWAGHDRETALKIAAWSLFGTFTAVEILDGYTTKYRFSKEDVVMNALGVGAAVLMERNKALDALIDLRLHYRPSDDPAIAGGFDPFGDYQGQTYLIVGKASGVPALREHPVLRYLEIAAGYGARGYHLPATSGFRERNFYYGVSLNLSELLSRTVYRNEERKSRLHRGLDGLLEVFQIPGTIVLGRKQL